MNERTCSVEGCDQNERARGFCPTHWYRNRHGISLDVAVGAIERKRVGRLCDFVGCGKPHEARGFCSTHYARLMRGIPLDGRMKQRCSVSGCEGRYKARGYCFFHYERQRNGIPLDAPKRQSAGGWLGTGGYRYVKVKGKAGPTLEHRRVMEAHLGRPLERWENVHHLNGRRTDNRVENLELWVKPQPVGQRPEDLAAWVVEHYPDLVEQAIVSREAARSSGRPDRPVR